MVVIPAPKIGAAFLSDLRGFDELLEVVWSAAEDVEEKIFAHWIVMRRLPEREQPWVYRNKLLVRGQRHEVVCHWTLAGCYRPLDRRLFDYLAGCDPGRWGGKRFEAYKRMVAAQDAAEAKARAEARDRDIEEGTEEVVRQASRLQRLAVVTVNGRRDEHDKEEESSAVAGG